MAPAQATGRRQRAALIALVLLASLALSVVIGLKHPDPPAVIACCYVFLGVYTRWAIASINSPELSRVGTSSLALVNGRDVVKGVER